MIIENATAPFTKIIADQTKLIRGDRPMIKQGIIELCSEIAFTKALGLASINNAWVQYGSSGITVTCAGLQIQLETEHFPNPLDRWKPKALSATHTPEAFAMLQVLAVPLERATTDKANLTRSLNALFESCTTLNQAMKVMPSLFNWVDEPTRVRYNTPTTRAEKDTRTPEEKFAEAFGEDSVAALARSRIS